MKGLFSQPENERRATLAGVNLFFSVLLGANLGSINSLGLYDYVMLAILLAGATSGLFLIAVSRRRKVIWFTFATYAAILGAFLLFPELRPARMAQETERIVATLAIWLVMLVCLKLTPVASEHEPAPDGLGFDDPVADALIPRDGSGKKPG